jgi:Dolichyl-phosphate-mannose-protein mannosyltransferase
MISRADMNELVADYSDAGTYFIPAQNLIDQREFLNNKGKPMITRTPGYPVFLAGIMLLVGRDMRTVLIAQTIILSCGPLILYWVARQTLPPVMAVVAGLIAAFSPWGAVLAVAPMSDGLFLFLLTLIFLLIKLEANLQPANAFLGAALIGILTGIAVLVRPIWPLTILIAAAFFFYNGYYGAKRKGVWLLLLVNLACAITPLALWRDRNQREAHFDGISDISEHTAWLYLAARVRAEITGLNRYEVSRLAEDERNNWGVPLSSQEAATEAWRRSAAIFREHPLVTVYSFGCSAFEHFIHPSPDVVRAVRLNFFGDIVVLAILWGGLLLFSAYALLRPISNPTWEDGYIDWQFVLAMLVVSGALTLSSGVSFGAASRLRAPMEVIVPLLTAVGLVRLTHGLYQSK